MYPFTSYCDTIKRHPCLYKKQDNDCIFYAGYIQLHADWLD